MWNVRSCQEREPADKSAPTPTATGRDYPSTTDGKTMTWIENCLSQRRGSKRLVSEVLKGTRARGPERSRLQGSNRSRPLGRGEVLTLPCLAPFEPSLSIKL